MASNILTDARIRSIVKRGKARRFSDGRGLYQVLKPKGAASWVLRAQFQVKRTDYGLGSFQKISLPDDRAKAHHHHLFYINKQWISPVLRYR